VAPPDAERAPWPSRIGDTTGAHALAANLKLELGALEIGAEVPIAVTGGERLAP
jgi:hypothetical protein